MIQKIIIHLKKEIVSLQQQLTITDQFARSNGIKMINIPQQENEQIISTAKGISEAIGFNFDELKIDSCYPY